MSFSLSYSRKLTLIEKKIAVYFVCRVNFCDNLALLNGAKLNFPELNSHCLEFLAPSRSIPNFLLPRKQ